MTAPFHDPVIFGEIAAAILDFCRRPQRKTIIQQTFSTTQIDRYLTHMLENELLVQGGGLYQVTPLGMEVLAKWEAVQ